MFKKTVELCVMFFEESVKGLSVGAPVIWQGVEVGSVSSHRIKRPMRPNLTVRCPRCHRSGPESHVEIEGKRYPAGFAKQLWTHLIAKRGCGPDWRFESFVTGSSMIEIEFFPDTPIRLTGLDTRYPEIPTVRSPMNKLAQKLENLPIEKIAGKLDRHPGDP